MATTKEKYEQLYQEWHTLFAQQLLTFWGEDEEAFRDHFFICFADALSFQLLKVELEDAEDFATTVLEADDSLSDEEWQLIAQYVKSIRFAG